MKFEDKYPDRPINEPDEYGMMRFAGSSPCWHCGELTDWCDIDFQAPLCSEECQAAKIEGWRTAYNASDRRT